MEVIPGGRNEKLECSGFARVTPGDCERGVPLLPTIPHFCISRSVESSAWPQLRISECGLFSKAGQHPELYKDENEARDPKSVGFEEDTTHVFQPWVEAENSQSHKVTPRLGEPLVLPGETHPSLI